MFVGFGAGGSTDIIARDIGRELEKMWGQPVIIENRAGANGAIAAGQLAKLPADGQTLMMIVSGHVTNGHLNKQQPFDALKDFTPIVEIASSPLLIFAHPSFPANDMKSMLALAKEKPGDDLLFVARHRLDPASVDGACWPISRASSSRMCPIAPARSR